jgi:carbamate kinase
MRTVTGLGGNALLQRGESPDAGIEEAHVTSAVTALTTVLRHNQLLITHGNGPQAGVLAVESAGDPALSHPYPFDSVPLRRARRADPGNDRVPAGPGAEHRHPRAPAQLRARPFPAGSMAPKVAADCRVTETTGRPAVIGRLDDAAALLDGTAGTIVTPKSGQARACAAGWARP